MRTIIRLLWVFEVVLFIIVLSPFIILMAFNWLFTSNWELPFNIGRNKLDDWSSSIERRRRKL